MTEIWVPRSFTGDKPRFVCRLCNQREYTQQALARHIKDHYKHDEAQIRFMSARESQPELFGDDGVDVEYERWCRDRGFNARDV